MFTKQFNISVRCVRCNAKLDCALRESDEHDLVVLVDRHNCHAVEHSVQPTPESGRELPVESNDSEGSAPAISG